MFDRSGQLKLSSAGFLLLMTAAAMVIFAHPAHHDGGETIHVVHTVYPTQHP
ncbi:hypothetical protein [Roseibium denhamense]|uniref:Uncharacterized protein n=1 Tax=Roseibium denhamense TaxID=76305 RepID=A0ABY1NU51_9HYPH|nr:hypothetical protein [Roseibium denhamense]SMP18283.1 hypothetical protein SAMN06265374_1893 [Roseibium denhamense]